MKIYSERLDQLFPEHKLPVAVIEIMRILNKLINYQ